MSGIELLVYFLQFTTRFVSVAVMSAAILGKRQEALVLATYN